MKKTQVEKTVSELCSHECTFSCFKADCPRGAWHTPKYPVAPTSKSGTGTECPLLQFEAEQLPEIEAFNPLMYRMSVNALDKVCMQCKVNSDDTNEYLAHCLDCLCAMTRDCIEESLAEARWS